MKFWKALAFVPAIALVALCSADLTRSNPHEVYAAQLETAYALAPGSLRGLIAVESNWNPNARGAHGEIGLGQIKPNTLLKMCPECSSRGAITYGARGKDVARIQSALAYAGIYRGQADGVWGGLTHAAVLAFQQANALQQDGIVGPRTWFALFGELLPQSNLEAMLLDPYRNMEWAARYLTWLRDKLGTDDAMILAAAYNAGDAGASVRYMVKVRKAIVRYKREVL